MANRVDASTLIRKGFHFTSPLWLIWFWMPPDAWVGVRKEAVMVSILSVALLIEAARLMTGRHFLGFREDESNRISSYAWGSIGLAMGLFFFPGEIVIVTFWGMAWIDPFCAYTRKRGGYPWIPLGAYVVLAVGVSLLVVPTALYQTAPLGPSRIAAFAILGGVLALVAEKPNWKHVDDDFLMHVVPMVALAALFAVL